MTEKQEKKGTNIWVLLLAGVVAGFFGGSIVGGFLSGATGISASMPCKIGGILLGAVVAYSFRRKSKSVVAKDEKLASPPPTQEAKPQAQESKPPEQAPATSAQQTSSGDDASEKIKPLETIIENLEVLKEKISKKTAYLGVLGGFAVFGFSLFMAWAQIPAGIQAADGGYASGWAEKGYLAITPLMIVLLLPVIRQKAVDVTILLAMIVMSFAVLGYDNVLHRMIWYQMGMDRVPIAKLGSELGAGFWLGLVAIVAVSTCGIAWALHTKGQTSGRKSKDSE